MKLQNVLFTLVLIELGVMFIATFFNDYLLRNLFILLIVVTTILLYGYDYLDKKLTEKGK